MNYTDKMTLDEIKDNDFAMVKDAVKNANKYSFGLDKQKALLFAKHCLDITLKRVGIHVNPPSGNLERQKYEKILDQQIVKEKVRIEHRDKYTANESWRNGIYMFKNDELVAFISDILTVRREEYVKETMKLSKRSVGYFVVTNARIDPTQRIYTPSKILH